MFRIGEVVEAQCSQVFMKANEGAARMKLILRALALVNSDHLSVSSTTCMKSNPRTDNECRKQTQTGETR